MFVQSLDILTKFFYILLLFISQTIVIKGQTSDSDTIVLIKDLNVKIETRLIDRNDYYLDIYNENQKILSDTFPYTGPVGGLDIIDFNEDNLPDIMFTVIGNNAISYLYLFDSIGNRHVKVENFSNFPQSSKILNTEYYFSYHRAGCADMNWESDLYKIVNFQIFHLGNIYGRGCLVDDEQKIEVYIIENENERLIKTFPIEIIGEFDDFKIGFIEDFWTKNYRDFD